ncbi:AEC family transporter [Paracoccus suum]|uniref:AEC family transporter n=1 Tax=Paracoccus suum TaxID=2259340 RepID=A0A344PLW9_9RHOB|nr:AEC family transporter [Paracoccus suum]AXC50374.1 AEC family transporter [Paracoccus suum]
MLIVLATLLPDLALIALGGWLVRRTGAEVWRGIDRINFDLLLPALLFLAAARRPASLADLGTIGLSIWALAGIGLLAGMLLMPNAGPQARLDFAGQWQTCWRFSTPLAFVAVAAFPDRVQGLMGVAVGAGVPISNLLAVTVLSRGGGLGFGATLLRVALNPFLLASLAGLAVGLLDLHPPGPLMAMAQRLADAAIPMALLSMGATLDWQALHRPRPREAAFVAIKLLALPLAALVLGLVLGLPADQRAVLLLIAALPTAPSAHVLAGVFGANPRPVATLIAQGTIAAALTLPVWMVLALHFQG